MPAYRYAAFPDAKVFDDTGKQINHLLFGDWVRVESEADSKGMVKVHVRGTDGWMFENDLRKNRVLEVVFTDVGQGDGCLVVTPKDKHFVIDAGASDNMYRFLKWRYAGFRRKWTFESAILTHPDMDHYRGFGKLFEESNVHFESVYHNGIMEQYGQNPLGKSKKINGRRYLTELIRTKSDLASFLSETDRWKGARGRSKLYPSTLKKALDSGRVGDIRMLATDIGQTPVFIPGYEEDKDVSIQVLGPVMEFDSAGNPLLRAFGPKPSSTALDKGKTKNGHSIILLLKYGNTRLLFGGDLNKSAEVFLLNHYSGLPYRWPWTSSEELEIVNGARSTFGVDVMKACHHGSADFTDTFLKAAYPSATVISSGDEESHAHPRPDTLGAIGLHGRGWRPLLFSTELMRSTREDEGSKAEDIGRLRQKLEDATEDSERRRIQEEIDEIVDELLERNVTVYGSINLRTDGKNTIMAYKLEKERRIRKSLTKWDIYSLEKAGEGPISYRPDLA